MSPDGTLAEGEIEAILHQIFQKWKMILLSSGSDWYYSDRLAHRLINIANGDERECARYDLILTELKDDAESGDPVADRVMRGLAAHHLACGKRMPEPVLAYAINALRHEGSRRRRGRSSRSHLIRDLLIADAVCIAAAFGKLNVTRSRSSSNDRRRASGCSIVASALHKIGISMSEDGVAKIWQRAAHRKRAGIPAAPGLLPEDHPGVHIECSIEIA